MKKLYVASIAATYFLLLGCILAVDAFAETGETAKNNAGRAVITFENDLIDADIDQAPLRVVAKQIEKQTGTHFVIKDTSILNYPLSISIKEAKLDEALKRIFKHYSYVAYYNSGGLVNKVVIFGAKASAARGSVRPGVQFQSNSAAPEVSDKSQSASAETIIRESRQPPGNTAVAAVSQRNTGEGQAPADVDDSDDGFPTEDADIPYDLDEYQSLPETLSDADMSTPGVDAMENPESMRLAAEEQEARQELINQAKLERSLNALNSEHPHLRAMAVDELVSLKDPRTTSALAGAANSKELDSEERRRVVEALWHHAGDLEFADPTANEALQQMASDSDPAVREIARRALHDMERYRRRNNQ